MLVYDYKRTEHDSKASNDWPRELIAPGNRVRIFEVDPRLMITTP